MPSSHALKTVMQTLPTIFGNGLSSVQKPNANTPLRCDLSSRLSKGLFRDNPSPQKKSLLPCLPPVHKPYYN